jgi:hypothetical protein
MVYICLYNVKKIPIVFPGNSQCCDGDGGLYDVWLNNARTFFVQVFGAS